MTLDGPEFPELRVSTITPASIGTLQKAGAWPEVAPPNSAEFMDMQVWDFAGPGHVRWSSRDVGAPRMGVVAENRVLQAALMRAAAAEGTHGRPVEVLAPESIESLKLPGDQEEASSASCGGGNALAELGLSGGRVLRCRLVVGADGSQSRLRQMAGLRTAGWPYHQRGLVATVSTSHPNATAWQRFLPDGPLALLPVRGGYSNIVWTNTEEGARQLEGMSSSEFADAANAALQGVAQEQGRQQQWAAEQLAAAAASVAGVLTAGVGALARGALGGSGGGGAGGGGAFVSPPLVLGYVGGPPRSFPLRMQHSGRYVLPRLALVGDAAHTVHPLAGQGVNLGLGDAQQLADALAGAREVGRDIGELPLLRDDYESPRMRANLGMMASLESIQRIFCSGGGALGAARAAGLGLVNASGPLKDQLMKYAMGAPPA